MFDAFASKLPPLPVPARKTQNQALDVTPKIAETANQPNFVIDIPQLD